MKRDAKLEGVDLDLAGPAAGVAAAQVGHAGSGRSNASVAGPAAKHVAIIMDGNGRWARARHLPRIAGHRAGAAAVRRVIEAAIGAGVEWLTLYAFSSENWRRPADEVGDLTGLLRHYLRHEVDELHRQGVRLRFIGDRDRFDADIGSDLVAAEHLTMDNTRLDLVIALSYGSRAEIVAAARRAIAAVHKGEIEPGMLDEKMFGSFLATAAMPDPDLLIRTSGEHRLSNFLLWQCAYTEFVFQDVLWPDYGPDEFAAALAEFAKRERRFGARPG